MSNASDAAVIASLEQRLPRWQGPQAQLPGPTAIEGVPGSGWWGEGAPDYERTAAPYSTRIRMVTAALDASPGVEVLNTIPAVTQIPDLSFTTPLSYPSVRINANAGRYRSLRDFDMDMARIFEKARRFCPEQSPQYGKIIVLQRLYNALTAPYPLRLPPSGIPDPSPTLFASLPAGPGNARSQHETNQELRAGAAEQDVGFGVTTFRVGTKDRLFTTEARHKGMAYKVGDFVHLINPDDASRPIIGQIFKTFVPTKGFRTHHVTVCWYYRPEQTVHTQDRVFYEREVFKTSHFCDHPVEDVIERISVQFYVKWIRGRSKAPEYYPGWPLYICHSRYNDKLWATVRIKNWGSCIPDELRQTHFMDVVSFDRQVEPATDKSPFLKGIAGPGFFAEPRGKTTEEEEEREPILAPTPVTRPPPAPAPAPASASTALPVASPSPAMLHTPTPAPYRPGPVTPWSTGPRGIVTALGGPSVTDQVAIRDMLPPDTAKLFERDSRGQVLWFSGMPLAPGTVKQPSQPGHSIEYLDYLVKRKRGEATERRPLKRPATEDKVVAGDSWWAEGMTEEEIFEQLVKT